MRNLVILLAVAFLPIQGKPAKWKCSTTGNVETCNVYIDASSISVTATDVGASNTQLQQNWCWLASIEMAFRYHGYIVPQAKLLDLLWGSIQDMPGGPEQIIGATNRVYTDEGGKRFRAESVQLSNWDDITAALVLDVPVLVGSQGHMTMIVGLQVQALYDGYGKIIDQQITEVILWDPWPGNGLRNMSASEFANTSLAVAVGATLLDPVTIRRPMRPAPKAPKSLTYFNLLGRTLR